MDLQHLANTRCRASKRELGCEKNSRKLNCEEYVPCDKLWRLVPGGIKDGVCISTLILQHSIYSRDL